MRVELEVVYSGSSFNVGKRLINITDIARAHQKYESSAYFIMEFLGDFACRQAAATTYEGGPITEPWILL